MLAVQILSELHQRGSAAHASALGWLQGICMASMPTVFTVEFLAATSDAVWQVNKDNREREIKRKQDFWIECMLFECVCVAVNGAAHC